MRGFRIDELCDSLGLIWRRPVALRERETDYDAVGIGPV